MKPLSKDELYENLSGFLKTKGIELKDGSYANGIQKGCSILADVINLGQQGLEKAKSGVDQKLDQMRQVIHEKTAPKSAAGSTPASAPPPPPPSASATEAPSLATKTRGTKTRKHAKGRKTGK